MSSTTKALSQLGQRSSKMVRGIKFTDKRFREEDDDNMLCPMTENTIILCHDYKLMDTLAKEIMDTINDETENNQLDCDDEDVGNAKMWMCFGLQRIIDVNGQRITLALEPSVIYKANSIDDIWLFNYHSNNETQYQEFIYPITIFKGAEEIWNKVKDELYKTICAGNFGTYDGCWVDLGRTSL